MLRRTLLRRLIDDPGVWCRGILTHAPDELLLVDWKQPEFNAYEGCNVPWQPSDGYVKNFCFKGPQLRIFGHFAMRYRDNPFMWQPALIDTGAKGIYLCQRTLHSLGVKHLAGSTESPIGPTIRIGGAEFSHVQTTEDQGDTATGVKLDGHLNILGLDFLGEAILDATLAVVQKRIGHPVPFTELIVTDGAVAFPVTPSKPTVMHLKQAIKAELGTDFTGSPARIIIKHPNGTKMGDEDRIDASVKYVFAVPKL